MAKKIADVRDEKSLAALNKIIGLLENKKKFDEMIKKGRTMHQRKTVREFEKKLVGNLDKNNSQSVRSLFKEISNDATIIIATHDNDYLEIADKAYELNEGKLIKIK